MTEGHSSDDNKNTSEDWTYEELLARYKEDLKHFQFVTKKEMVINLARKLEETGAPKDMIAARLIEDLKGYDVSSNYIRECLGEEYKQDNKKREKFARKNVANDVEKPIELSTSGTTIRDYKPLPKKPPMDERDLELGKLKEQLAERTKQFHDVLEGVNKSMDKNPARNDVRESLEYKALESRLYVLEEENKELRYLESQHIKQNPGETFQQASSLKEAQPEIQFPARDIGTFFMDCRNAKSMMFLKIKDGIVIGWESDTKRSADGKRS